MAIFRFSQQELELFWRYLAQLHGYLVHYTQHSYVYERWEILNIVKERVNGDACAHLELAGFLLKVLMKMVIYLSEYLVIHVMPTSSLPREIS